MKTRTLSNGKSVTLHQNDGLRKRCDCPRRAWPKCPHSWHFSFKWKGVHHRFPLDHYTPHHIAEKDKARAESDRLRSAIREGKFPPAPVGPAATPSDLTFTAFAELWRTRARQQVSDSQQGNEGGIVRRFCALELAPGEQLGDRPIGRVTEDDLETAFAQLTTANATKNKYRQVLIHLERWGVRKGYLSHKWLSEDTSITREEGGKRDRRLHPDELDDKGRLVTLGEERRLLAVASAWLQRLIIAALETACRRGELLSLQWSEVDLPRGEIKIRAEKAKTNESRSLPISPRLRAVLDMVRNDPAGKPHKPTAYVFGDPVGGQIVNPKKSWLKACRLAGVAGLHFHDLRHEAGSRLLEAGWPLHHVQAMLGHADVKTTSVYLNLTRASLQDSMRKFGTSAETLPTLAHDAISEPPPPGNDDAATPTKSLVN